MDELSAWVGKDVFSRDGAPIGTIVDVYVDDQTEEPEWLAVAGQDAAPGLSFVPVPGITQEAGRLVAPYDRAAVNSAPHVSTGDTLSAEEEERLYRHYGLEQRAGVSGGGEAAPTDDAMTRSEDVLHVAKTTREAGRVRLRKWVETERVSEAVPVAREVVNVEREPVTADNIDKAMAGPDISEAEHEVTLHEEQVVAETETVPKERVRLNKEVVVGEEQVEADLRRERIELEGT